MTFYVENETDDTLPFDAEQAVRRVAEEILCVEKCPYEAEVNIILTDNEGIRTVNRAFRNIDKETDVLSFPNVSLDVPADFSSAEANEADCFNPDSGELMLGDIMISLERVYEQAKAYEHSILREFSFLIAHSMLHLLGYDHIASEDARVMEAKQEAILEKLHITREIT